MSEDESVRKLAEVKAYMEKRMAEVQDEASKIKAILEVIDATLAEKSFKKMELPQTASPSSGLGTTFPSREASPRQVVPLNTPEGAHLADMSQSESELIITPVAALRFDVTSPPFKAFLIGRVLDPMRGRDSASVSTGELTPDKVLSYSMEQEGNLMKKLTIKNYGDERRVQELRNAIRWTLRRMYERSLTDTN